MSPLIVKKAVIGAKVEVTQGTAIALTATDYFLATEPTITFDVERFTRQHRRSTLDQLPSYIGRRNAVIHFLMEVRGSSAAGTEHPPYLAVLEASLAALNTNVPVTSNTLNPVSDPASANFYGPGKSCTVELFLDGVKHIVAGCVGRAVLTGETGKIMMWDITLSGKYADPTDTAFPTQDYSEEVVGPQFLGASLSIQGFSPKFAKLTVDFGSLIEPRDDANDATGRLGFLCTGKEPSGTLDPEMELIATEPWVKTMLDATEGILEWVVGATAGNIHTFNFPKAQYTGWVYSNRNGILTGDLSMQMNISAGDDWFSYAIT